jgi:hypothetical protein
MFWSSATFLEIILFASSNRILTSPSGRLLTYPRGRAANHGDWHGWARRLRARRDRALRH